ncbi:MAG: hypothetical protein ACE5R6_18030 [Candidatus Heimdallarchaeota archaeon]
MSCHCGVRVDQAKSCWSLATGLVVFPLHTKGTTPAPPTHLTPIQGRALRPRAEYLNLLAVGRTECSGDSTATIPYLRRALQPVERMTPGPQAIHRPGSNPRACCLVSPGNRG